MFEVCPGEQLRAGLDAELDQPHEIRKMVDMGLRCTLNTDDPAMFSDEHGRAIRDCSRMQGFTWAELWKLNRATLDATFLSDAEKATYGARMG